MCFGLDLFGTKSAAKRSADATLKAANMQAQSDRDVARATVQSMETQIAQKKASDYAAEVLGVPQEKPTVLLSAQTTPDPVDPVTGRRKSTRSQFFKNTSLSI